VIGKPGGENISKTEAYMRVDIKVVLRETVWQCVISILLAENNDRKRAVVNTVMNYRVLSTEQWVLLQFRI